jgi:hypothetical protein
MICPKCKKNSISPIKSMLKRYKGLRCPKCLVEIIPIENKKIFLIPYAIVTSFWFVVALVFNVGVFGDLYVYFFIMIGIVFGLTLDIILNIKFRKFNIKKCKVSRATF